MSLFWGTENSTHFIQDIESFQPSGDVIKFEDIDDDSDVVLLVPHSDASALTAMVCVNYNGFQVINDHFQKVNLEVEYTTVDEPTITRISSFSRVLITTLPISVNVEDFFRGTR